MLIGTRHRLSLPPIFRFCVHSAISVRRSGFPCVLAPCPDELRIFTGHFIFPGGIRDAFGETRISTCTLRKIRHPSAFHAESQKETQTLALSARSFRALRVIFIFHVTFPMANANFSNSALSFGVSGLLRGFPSYLFIFHVTFPVSALLLEGLP